MFYDALKKNHGLPHDPMKAIVAPRPIGWISTVSSTGQINLAPYSFFNALANNPDLLMFSSVGRKDSVRNCEETGEFVFNHVGMHIAEKMNATSAHVEATVNEFELAGLEMADCNMISPPRVAAACAAMECKVTDIFEPKDLDGNGSGNFVVIGQVVGVHIDDKVIKDGRFDVTLAKPVTRLGYLDFEGPDGLFSMPRPENYIP